MLLRKQLAVWGGILRVEADLLVRRKVLLRVR